MSVVLESIDARGHDVEGDPGKENERGEEDFTFPFPEKSNTVIKITKTNPRR